MVAPPSAPGIVSNASQPQAPKPAQEKKNEPKPAVALTPPAPAPEVKAVSPMPGGPGTTGGAAAPEAAANALAATNPPTALAGASALPSPPALPLELAALDTQFQQLQNERVTAAVEKNVAALNTIYTLRHHVL